MFGPESASVFFLEKLGLHLIFTHAIYSINWQCTPIIIAVCEATCTAETLGVKRLQMQHHSYLFIVLGLIVRLGSGEECKHFHMQHTVYLMQI